ncbi:MAG: choice-of-anchor L domain-containing protein [Flavobacteriales bacterium]
MKNERVGIIAVATLLSATTAFGQLVVNTQLTPTQLVEDVLVGNCVTVSNITYNGSATPPPTGNGRGSFISNGTNLGITNGVILSSGNANDAGQSAGGFAGSTNSTGSDPDLVALSGQDIADRAVLEFDFVPTGDSISFRFVFASEEYPEFVCSNFNDAFGFFLSGPGINGPFQNNAINLAVIPQTTIPITINSVNSGSPGGLYEPETCALSDPNWQNNSIYYVDNMMGTSIIYDGFTTVLTARAAVQCNQTHHIKLALGDGGDSGYDSAVFLEGGSFSSVPFVPELTPGPSIVGNTILESCLDLEFDFLRTACDLNTTETVQISYSGSAVNGVDIVPALPTTLNFGTGESVITVPFTAPLDADGPEDLIMTLETIDCNGNPAINVFTFIIDEVPDLVLLGSDTAVACGDPVLLTPMPGGGFGQYTYQWSTGETTPTLTVVPDSPTTIEVTVTDLCNATVSASYQVGLTAPPPLNMNIIGDSDLTEGCEIGTVNIIRPAGSLGELTVSLTGTGTATNNNDYVLPGQWIIPDGVLNNQFTVPVNDDAISEGDETIIVTAAYTNACSQTVTAAVTFTILDVSPLTVMTNDINAECSGDTLLIAAAVDGGVGPFTYEWSNGAVTSGIWVPLFADAQYSVTVTDDCGRVATDGALVSIDCEVIIPNVFSPNSDGANDRWEIDGLGSRGNTVRVFNRWGQLVLDAKNYQNTWTATDVPDGTYFYEVLVNSKDKPYTGHLTILRKY